MHVTLSSQIDPLCLYYNYRHFIFYAAYGDNWRKFAYSSAQKLNVSTQKKWFNFAAFGGSTEICSSFRRSPAFICGCMLVFNAFERTKINRAIQWISETVRGVPRPQLIQLNCSIRFQYMFGHTREFLIKSLIRIVFHPLPIHSILFFWNSNLTFMF